MTKIPKAKGLTRRKVLTSAAGAVAASQVIGTPLLAQGKRKLRYIAFINRKNDWKN